MSHLKAKMHQIRFLTSVRLSHCLFVCVLDRVWHLLYAVQAACSTTAENRG